MSRGNFLPPAPPARSGILAVEVNRQSRRGDHLAIASYTSVFPEGFEFVTWRQTPGPYCRRVAMRRFPLLRAAARRHISIHPSGVRTWLPGAKANPADSPWFGPLRPAICDTNYVSVADCLSRAPGRMRSSRSELQRPPTKIVSSYASFDSPN